MVKAPQPDKNVQKRASQSNITKLCFLQVLSSQGIQPLLKADTKLLR